MKKRNKTYRQLEREKKEAKRIRIRSPFHHLRISTNLPLIAPSLPPRELSLPHSANTPPHHSTAHTRADKAQVPDPSRRDIPLATPAHRAGDDSAAGYCHSTQPLWCASCGMFGIPTMRAGYQNLRICGKETRLGCDVFARHVRA